MIITFNMRAGRLDQLASSELYRSIIAQKRQTQVVYTYRSPEALDFELAMRGAIVQAARDFHAGGAQFATFKNSRANESFWTRMPNGGLRLREEVLPSDAIRDIFNNGGRYAMECATAMVVILYKGVLDTIGDKAFNRHFNQLVLYDWQYDSDLQLTRTPQAAAGDVVYFENPDFNPETPEWQGENAILLDDHLYFGHGLGIKSADAIINALNGRRKSGSSTSAYLSDLVVHPDFEYIRRLQEREESHS
ncbi:protein-glutamine gamma-glutamyltransferase [Paenibacillus woosongensis]|uniref:Protein-glutamine gamma-glutamyltransferase n=1 Tax=Paenibacillus woosongensis TaxID=307580 RepID=A0A7X2Z2D1_9BACL|nr:protein-glutamine gamma-glutamyltransferase [Paenibacillus woosongensis]MUG46222.1 protein-glutamine gamma-glutamyltransferase [Paenibacillus woosongensis]